MSSFPPGSARSVEINGTPLSCQVCSHDAFVERPAQLNTRAATFFGFDWANPTARCYICERCGYIHWFMPPR
jgi:hypothetical protein